MAENVLETRILLRYATYAQWMNSDVILRPGEAAIAAFPNKNVLGRSDDTPANTPPAIGIKIGDGQHYFEELPWVQGVAADVYQWAKASTKPTYSANEIQGLTEFIGNVSGGGSGGSNNNAYRIIYDSTNSKYILQIYDNSLDDWVNTSSEISLQELYNRISTIERWANGARTNLGNIEAPIAEYVYEEIIKYLNNMDYNDTVVSHQFVTSVVQENGRISVTRAAITASDVTGVLNTAQGGTGLTYVEDDEVLVGDRNGNITTRKFVTEIDSNRAAFATVGAIKDYVDQQTAGLTGAMHFVGETSVEITTNPPSRVNPNIPEYNFSRAQPGDVILDSNAKEFVWTGSYWRLLGDEGSYAIKGSIVNADIDDNANISQSKIDGLTDALAGKVDVEVGKGLSTNDYTTEEKQKLAGIEDGAQKNVIEHIILNDNEAIPRIVNGQANTVELTVKEFDDIARAKLETIDEGAQVNAIESIALNGTVQAPDQNKQVNLTVRELSVEDKAKLDSIEAGAQVNTIEHVYLNDTEVQIDPQGKRIDLNITGITQEQIEKLNSIEEGAQVNVIERIIYNNVALSPDNNKTVTIDSDPHTEHENIIEHITLNGSEVQPDNNKTVALEVTGTLSQQQIDKLNGIEENAEVNIIEGIQVNGEPQEPNNNRIVNLILNAQTLGLNFISGAEVPYGANSKDEIDIIQGMLQLARIAMTGDVTDLLQSAGTYIILDCGTSDSDTHNT